MLFFTGEGNFDTNSGAIRENDWLRGQIIIIMTVPGDTRPEGLDAAQQCAGYGRSVDLLLKSQNLTTFVIDDLFCLAIKRDKI